MNTIDVEPKKGGKSAKHKELQKTAITWLYERGCSVFAEEVPTRNGIADALGIRTRSGDEAVYYIEAKQSRSDLVCLKQRAVYLRSVASKAIFGEGLVMEDTGIDFYYLIVSDNVIVEPSLYPEWGVIDERGKVIRKAKRMKRENHLQEQLQAIAHVLVYKVFGKMYL